MARVSIIVPVAGGANQAWLDEALDSIEAQSYRDFELTAVDDPHGRGAWWARNEGLERSRSELIVFCDADDLMPSHALAALVEAAKDSDLVCGSFAKFGTFNMLVTHDAEKISLANLANYVMANLHEPARFQMLSGCWAKIYRRHLVTPFEQLTTAEDMAFNFDYLRRCKSVRFLSEVVYRNRKHPGSLTTIFDAQNPQALFCVEEALGYVKRFLLSYYPEPEIEKALDRAKRYHSMLYFMRACEQKGGTMRDTFKAIYP